MADIVTVTLQSFLIMTIGLLQRRREYLRQKSLLIDEISMLSARTFDMVEFVCWHVKKTNKLFGGLQVCSIVSILKSSSNLDPIEIC